MADAFKRGHWDGYRHLISGKPDSFVFPTGILDEVTSFLEHNHCEIELTDERVVAEKQFNWHWISDKELRDYQIEAVAKAIDSSRGIWGLATGSGKMLTAAKLIQELGLRTTVAVVTKEAVRDTVKEFKHSIGGAKIGAWYSVKKETGDIVVTTIKSIDSNIDDPSCQLTQHFKDSDLLIIDEVHLGGANTYYKTIMSSNAYYKIGMSGTAERQDGSSILLHAVTGKMLIERKADALQREGILSKSNVVFYKSNPPDHLGKTDLVKLAPMDRYKESIVNNRVRNRLIKDVCLSKDVPTVVIVKQVEHGQILSELIGWPFVSGQTNAKVREEIQDGLNSGEINGIIATSIFDLSVNIPRLERIINAAGHSPKNAQTQRHGRVLRKAEGKEAAEFIDFLDAWEHKVQHHSERRISYMEKEGHIVNIMDFYTGEVEHKKSTMDAFLEELL